ncbi:MAG TPA: hypothetical protein VMW35_13800 [Myxococcota bacterium]|nr:hypothetical protein [Myxococcota bacterium]
MSGRANDAAPSPPSLVVADAHVHVHDCYEVGLFFDAAHANLAAAARGEAFHGLLLLSEGAGEDFFGRARALAAREERLEGWRFSVTQEPESLAASRDGKALLLVAGRQLACAEDLEVLALGTCARRDDGRPVREALAWARQDGALPVIPWGAGKWLFARGALLDALLDESRGAELYLGDESGRPALWPTPRHLGDAAARGIRNLPGTDPLPFPHETRRAGSFGFRLRTAFDPKRPAASLKAALRAGAAPEPFGRLESPLRFLRNQLAMQLRKRRRAVAAPTGPA